MIDFSTRTAGNIYQELMDRVPNWLDKREYSLIATALSTVSYTLEGIYLDLNSVQLQAYIETAVGDALDRIGVLVNVYRNPATAAIRLGIFNAPVRVDPDLENGDRFSTLDGTSTSFMATKALGMQDDGYLHYEMTCETVGTIGNEYFGSILAITSVPNLTYAMLADIIIPGTERESDEEYRTRLLLALREKEFAGNIASYRNYMLDQETVGAVQVYPVWEGPWTTKVVFLDANYDVATDALVTQMQNLICPPDEGQIGPSNHGYGVAPVGAITTVTTGTRLDVNIGMEITLSAGYTVNNVRDAIEQACADYLLSVRQNWGPPVVNSVVYPVIVYAAEIIVRVKSLEGIIDVQNVTLNGESGNLECTENGTLQQVPYVGTVTINGNT